MLYDIAHFVKERISLLWEAIEWGNAAIFALVYKKGLKGIPDILAHIDSDHFEFRVAIPNDASRLAKFFGEQPESAFQFFKPHGFDEKSLVKVIKNKAFLTFIVTDSDKIIGYFFLRCFINGKCFRGKIVDNNCQGRGIGTKMGVVMTKVAEHLKLRMFGSISPENYASMASAQASNEIKIHKTLDNGYLYIEFLPKEKKHQ